MAFVCSICGEESTRICARCTKDACNNHLCEKCFKCSDCCECEVTLADSGSGPPLGSARSAMRAAVAAHKPVPDPEPEPEAPYAPPDPDPFPEPDPEPGPVTP